MSFQYNGFEPERNPFQLIAAISRALGRPLTDIEIWQQATGFSAFDDLNQLSLAERYCAPLDHEIVQRDAVAIDIDGNPFEIPGPACGWSSPEPKGADCGARKVNGNGNNGNGNTGGGGGGNKPASEAQAFSMTGDTGVIEAKGSSLDFKQSEKTYADCPSINAYLKRVGATWRSLDTAVVIVEENGYPAVRARIKFSTEGEGGLCILPEQSKASPLWPTDEEWAVIKAEIAILKLPTHVLIERPVPASLAPHLSRAAREGRLFEFCNTRNQVVMYRERVEIRAGIGAPVTKIFIPHTLWSDGKWRQCEPGNEPLPFWGMEKLLARDRVTTVFLHEGEKAARFASRMCAYQPQDHVKAHPWFDELAIDCVHLGWIGGVNSVNRSNLRLPTFAIRFPSDWKKGFDIADSFPESCYKRDEKGALRFDKPSFNDCLNAATWATDEEVIPPERKGRPKTVYLLRPSFAKQWVFVAATGQYVNRRIPELAYKQDDFNGAIRPFSGTTKTADLLLKRVSVHCDGFAYRPGQGEFIPDSGKRLFNRWRPPIIKRIKGDVTPFLIFVAYLIPIESDRKQFLRFFTTLIAHPEIRMKFALLLVSEMQGTGKDTAAFIARNLVGRFNCSSPTADYLVKSDFNAWMVDKLLVVVSEIYQGHSWAAYNKLKDQIGRETLEANLKNVNPYDTDCYAAFWLNSNSLRCLKIEDKDRRLLIPRVTENKWDEQQFTDFYKWLLVGNGLEIILDWCHEYGDYVREGEEAPMTTVKGRMISESRSPLEIEIDDGADELKETKEAVAISARQLEVFFSPSVSRYHNELSVRVNILDRFRRKGFYVGPVED